MYKRILLPLDGSALAEQALPNAAVGLNPFAIVIAEVLVSNIGGTAGETGRGEEVELESILSGP